MSGEPAAGLTYATLSGGRVVGRLDGLSAVRGIAHLFSTRDSGTLAADDPAGRPNREALGRALGAERVVTGRQVHGTTVLDLDTDPPDGLDADALMTARRRVALLGLSADCPILLLADPVRGAVGMAHAGWRGTAGDIAGILVRAMAEAYGCRPGDLRAGGGPSAGPCCYAVGDEVVEAFVGVLGERAGGCVVRRDGQMYADLWRANALLLRRAGLAVGHIEVAGACSICDNRYFSYRREGVRAGRHGGMIARL
ncbi:MAG: polyphenol oxidase family protein [Planctomycetota bacterium]